LPKAKLFNRVTLLNAASQQFCRRQNYLTG